MLAQESKINSKLNSLRTLIRSFGSVLVAYSGGVDSSVVAKIAFMELGNRAVAVTADSPSMPPGELEDAVKVAKEIGIKHRVLQTHEMENSNYVENPLNRCYFCKDELMNVLLTVQAAEGLSAVIDGTNADDLLGPRPGYKAMRKHGSRSPLVELEISKPEVRRLARELGLSAAEKPSMACLSSRIQYGQPITVESLHQVGEAETFIKSLVKVHQLRVRIQGTAARIEVGKDERHLFFDEGLMDRISSRLLELGFSSVALDLSGYHSGSSSSSA